MDNVLTKEKFEKACHWRPSCEPSIAFPLRIIENKHCGEQKLRFRFRSWKERLFTLPWRPLKKMAFDNVWVANGVFYYLEKQNVVIGHPDDIYQLRKEFPNA